MSRQVTVYEASKNGKVTVLENVEATNLGELKRIMVSKGIDIENMDFMEGVSNVVLRDDNSVLPTNIPYKGSTTNNLFIYLSLKNKKISSGVMSRKEVYQYLNEHGLAEEVKRAFGRNYTQVSTEHLLAFIEATKQEQAAEPEKEAQTQVSNSELDTLRKAFIKLVEILYEDSCLYKDDFDAIHDILNKKELIPGRSFFEGDIENLIPR